MKNPFKSDNAPVIPNMLQYLSRSLSVPGARESDQGYNSYVGSCSVHGTLKRHISSGVDTTFEVPLTIMSLILMTNHDSTASTMRVPLTIIMVLLPFRWIYIDLL